jgi:ABC-type polysaccharide/polyol phosphate export permease
MSSPDAWGGFVAGATCAAFAMAAFLLWQFYRATRDRLFALFTAAFALMAVNRLLIVVVARALNENATPVYVIRLIAFLLIVYAIIDKNRAGSSNSPT